MGVDIPTCMGIHIYVIVIKERERYIMMLLQIVLKLLRVKNTYINNSLI